MLIEQYAPTQIAQVQTNSGARSPGKVEQVDEICVVLRSMTPVQIEQFDRFHARQVKCFVAPRLDFVASHVAVARQEKIGFDHAVHNVLPAGRKIGFEHHGAFLADGFENVANVLPRVRVGFVGHQHMVVAQAVELVAQEAHRGRRVGGAFEHLGQGLHLIGAKVQLLRHAEQKRGVGRQTIGMPRLFEREPEPRKLL